jgi:hypothetical protein
MAKSSPIDHSTAIARISVLLERLTESDPDGEWRHHKLVAKRQGDRYCLRLSEARSLLTYLEKQLAMLEKRDTGQLSILDYLAKVDEILAEPEIHYERLSEAEAKEFYAGLASQAANKLGEIA